MLGGPVLGAAATGTSGADAATTVTLTGVSAPGSTTAYNNMMIIMGAAWGIATSNTNAAPPVVTIDLWHDPTNPANTKATPAAGVWVIPPGLAPIQYLALTADSTAPAAGDTTLASEITTGGLGRAFGTYSHTGGTASAALQKVFTATATFTINKEAVFLGAANSAMPFESAEPSPPTLVSADQLTQTVTINY